MFLKAMFTGFAVAALALAQGGGMGGGGGAGGGMGTIGGAGQEENGVRAGGMGPSGGTRGAQKQTKADMIIDRLKLNKDQQSEFVTILQASAKDSAQVVQAVLQARNMYATAMINGKSGTDLEPLSKALSEAQFQMTGVEVRTFQKIVALLKPNQMAKAPEAFDEMADIFLPSMSGGGGRGMGGGGGMGRGAGGGGR